MLSKSGIPNGFGAQEPARHKRIEKTLTTIKKNSHNAQVLSSKGLYGGAIGRNQRVSVDGDVM